MALLPNQVGLPKDLGSIFSDIGTGAYNKIGSNYNAARGKAATDASVRGFRGGPTDYATDRLGTQQGLDTGTLESTIGGGLGDTGYKNQLADRDYQQQRKIAEATAAAMKPSLLEQIFAGIGGGASAVGNGAALYGMIPRGGGRMPMSGAGGYGYDDMTDPLAREAF